MWIQKSVPKKSKKLHKWKLVQLPKGRTIRKLMDGGGGAGEVQKKIRTREN